jgi:zinc protease
VRGSGCTAASAPSRAVPVVRVMLSLDLGIAGDDRARPGTQAMMLAMLDEGSNGALGARSGPQIARELERLGASFSATAGMDRTRLGLNALGPNLAPSLALFADMVRAPTFESGELERIRVQALTGLEAEASSPDGLAFRALPGLLYGPDHPYGLSFSGSGTAEGLQAITRADLQAFHARLRPEAATLFVVGDTSMAEILPLLEAHFGGWKSHAPLAPPAMAAAVPKPQPERIVFIDRPGAPQSLIVAGAVSPLTGRDNTLALTLANDVFGGGVTSRLNQELRETRNWSYGAASGFSATAQAMPFQISAPVQSDRTGDSIAAIRDLLRAFRTTEPPTQDEIDRARAGFIRALPGDFETGGALLGSLERNLALTRPDDHLATLPARLGALSQDDVARAPVPAPEQLVWVVVGDRASVLPQLRALGLPIEERAAGAISPIALPAAAESPHGPRR